MLIFALKDQINQILERYIEDPYVKSFVVDTVMESEGYSDRKFIRFCEQIYDVDRFFKDLQYSKAEIIFADKNQVIINNCIKLHPFRLNEMGFKSHPRSDLNVRVLLFEVTKKGFRKMEHAKEVDFFKDERIIFEPKCRYVEECLTQIYGNAMQQNFIGSLSTSESYRVNQVIGKSKFKNYQPIWKTAKKLMDICLGPDKFCIAELCNYVELISLIRSEKKIVEMMNTFMKKNPGCNKLAALYDDDIFDEIKKIYLMYSNEVEGNENGFATVSGATYHALKHGTEFMTDFDEEKDLLVPASVISNYLRYEIPFDNFDTAYINQNGTAWNLAFKKKCDKTGKTFYGYGRIRIDPDGRIPVAWTQARIGMLLYGEIEFFKCSKYRK